MSQRVGAGEPDGDQTLTPTIKPAVASRIKQLLLSGSRLTGSRLDRLRATCETQSGVVAREGGTRAAVANALGAASEVSGVRADLAVRFYGDDLAQLEALGEQAVSVINRVPGAADATCSIRGVPPSIAGASRL